MQSNFKDSFKLRRSQAIYTWGIGSNFDTAEGDALMLAGLDAWQDHIDRKATDSDRLRFNDIRLQKRLGVNYFLLPPEFIKPNNSFGRKLVNASLKLPFVRFPQWHLCPACRSMKKTDDLYLDDLRNGMICGCKSVKNMSPSRFVCICEDGHIQDFPYEEWAHLNDGNEVEMCSDPNIKFIDSYGPDLKDIIIRCTNCGKQKSLMSMKSTIKKHFKCNGQRPWLGEMENTECNKDLHATLRNASSVHNPIIRKSLFIVNPILDSMDEIFHKIVDDNWYMLNVRESDGTIDRPFIEKSGRLLAKRKGLDYEGTDKILSIIFSRLDYEQEVIDEIDEEIEEEDYRYKEYEVISKCEESLELKLEEVDLAPYKTLDNFFNKVIKIHRLRETIAYCGFTRINPFSGAMHNIQDSINQLRRRNFRSEEKWIPGIWNRGEGIFLSFDNNMLKNWSLNKHVSKHLKALMDRYEQYFDTFQHVNQNFILLHTFAHIIINELSYECGYGSSSIKERLYFSASSERPMNGVLIYTTGDSEGSLGGLVRLGQPEILNKILINGLEKARWCSLDPVCSESSGQGPDACNLAACHNCCLVAETCCENGNRLLDRSLLIDEKFGYFKDIF